MLSILKDHEGYLFDNKRLKSLILPLVAEQFLGISVGMVNTMTVSRVGEAAISGVSLVDTIMILIINIFGALATGGAVICGQYIGKGKPRSAGEAAEQLVVFTTVISFIVMGFLYIFRTFILRVVFGAISPAVMHNCRVYMMIVTASIPFIALYNAGAAIFRIMGNTKVSMLMSLIMNGINITGNMTLIYGLGFGVEGAAIPNLCARAVAGVVIVALLFNKKLPVHLGGGGKFRLNGMLMKKILQIGIPNGLENSLFQVGKIIVLSLVASFGTASIAANAVMNDLANFQNLPGIAMQFALLTITSQTMGAGDYKQSKYYTKKILTLAHIFIAASSILIMLLSPVFLGIYHISPEASKIVSYLIIYHGSCCIFIWAQSFVLPNALRAAGDVKFTMITAVISMWLFRIMCSWIFGKFFGLGVFGVWIAMTVDWLVRAIVFNIRYHGKRWIHQVI